MWPFLDKPPRWKTKRPWGSLFFPPTWRFGQGSKVSPFTKIIYIYIYDEMISPILTFFIYSIITIAATACQPKCNHMPDDVVAHHVPLMTHHHPLIATHLQCVRIPVHLFPSSYPCLSSHFTLSHFTSLHPIPSHFTSLHLLSSPSLVLSHSSPQPITFSHSYLYSSSSSSFITSCILILIHQSIIIVSIIKTPHPFIPPFFSLLLSYSITSLLFSHLPLSSSYHFPDFFLISFLFYFFPFLSFYFSFFIILFFLSFYFPQTTRCLDFVKKKKRN